MTDPIDIGEPRPATREYLRTVRIGMPIDFALYGELITLISTRWPDAKLTRDGIHIPEHSEQ